MAKKLFNLPLDWHRYWNEDSIVFDLGGYMGQWASDIFAMYSPQIHIFEPAPPFAKSITQRFARNRRITVHPFGLAADNLSPTLSLSADSSSVFSNRRKAHRDPSIQIKLVHAADFLEQLGVQMIDLIKINIEGGEYDLLDHLIQYGWVRRMRNIQVQFHTFVPNAWDRMRDLQARLAHSHTLTYQYLFIWENWQLKVEQ